MRAASNRNIRIAARLPIVVGLALTTACSALDQPITLGPGGPGSKWSCFADSAYFHDEDERISTSRSISGKISFKSVHPDPQWVSAATVKFTSPWTDPWKSGGQGISVAVAGQQPDKIFLFYVEDGQRKRLGTMAYGEDVPFTVTFDDQAGTVTIESGEYKVTTKPWQLARGTMDMNCSGAEVGFEDMSSEA